MGEVAEPSALVSPPLASSRIEVKITRFDPPPLPTALIAPLTLNGVPEFTLITTRGSIASVTPLGTVMVPVVT